METIKIITGIGTVLSGKMMLLNLLSNQHHTISFNRDETQVKKALEIMNIANDMTVSGDIIDVVGTDLKEVFLNNPSIKIIDIRMECDIESLLDITVTHIPVYQFEQESSALNKNQPVLVYCAHGINSQWATQILKQNNFKRIYHLVGGIAAL